MLRRLVLVGLAAFALGTFGCSSAGGGDPLENGADNAGSEDELRAVLGTQSLDPSKPARVLLVGDSAHLGDAPLEAALARARRYREVFPNDQIVIYLPDGDSTSTANGYGLKPVQADYAKMRGTAIAQSLLHFSKLVSVDFYGHSSPFGLSLDHTKGDTNLKSTTPNIGDLAAKFDRSRNPYATFNGCNAGIVAARELSAAWGIPVSGAFTGSNFERLHRDGHWYADSDGLTPSEDFVTTNAASYKTPVPCKEGACFRMRPMNYPYAGYYGRFGRGLGHYKFFCAFDDEATCAKGMAHALLGFPSVKPVSPSSPRADFEAVVLDYLCPTTADPQTFARCADALPKAAASGQGYTPFSDPSKVVECSMKSCDAEIACTRDADGNPQPGTCTIHAPPAPAESHTTPEEYKWFMRGFDLLAH